MATNGQTAETLVPFRSARELGALIRDVRGQQGLTQADLANRAAVGRQWLVSVEQGRRSGSEIGMLLRVLDVLGVELFARRGAASQPSRRELVIDGALDLDELVRETGR